MHSGIGNAAGAAASDVADEEPDEALLAAVPLAQKALLEITAAESVGPVIGHVVEGERVLSLLFAADLAGYPGWHWSVSVARVDDFEPTVLELALRPGDGALLAPDWIPWVVRLEEYRAAQAAALEAGETQSTDPGFGENFNDDDLDADDLDDLDEDDLDVDDLDDLDEDDLDVDDLDEDDDELDSDELRN